RQCRAAIPRSRICQAVQSLPAHEADHARQHPPRARNHDARGDGAGRGCGAGSPRRRAHARAGLNAMTIRLLAEPIVRAALIEDFGRAGDITTDAVVPADREIDATIGARQPGVVAGLDVALMAFELLDPTLAIEVICPDGSRVERGQTVARIRGKARPV